MWFFSHIFKNHGYIPDLVRIMIMKLQNWPEFFDIPESELARVLFLFLLTIQQGSEPAPSSLPCTMDGVWTENNFLLHS